MRATQLSTVVITLMISIVMGIYCSLKADAPNMAQQWLVFQGTNGPGVGKHVVFLSGDEEYRSEECLPMLAKILAYRHGFKCTVLFAIDPADGTINPNVRTNIPGISELKTADACVMFLRFRELPDEQMKYFVDYLNSGGAIIALRTSTHAFAYDVNKQSQYARFDWRSQDWQGGFGQQVLGETWVSHHGDHGKESTMAIPAPEAQTHPILKGIQRIWVPTDVYTVVHLPTNALVLMRGQVLAGMRPTDPPVQGKKNNPMMPVAWVNSWKGSSGKESKIFCSTMGSAVDFLDKDLRRLIINACYWAVGLEKAITPELDVDFIGEYKPGWFGFNGYKKGVRPSDYLK